MSVLDTDRMVELMLDELRRLERCDPVRAKSLDEVELLSLRAQQKERGIRTFASVQQFGEKRWYYRIGRGPSVGPFASEELALLDAQRGPA